ncbi:MAG: hypothetical protein K6F05_07130 [Succinivibrio sp.]|nr:hypothetical protein [Succinivibrio sp.]
MTASLISSTSNSKLLNNILTNTSSSTSGISVAKETMGGMDFSSALSALFKEQVDKADEKLSSFNESIAQKRQEIRDVYEKLDTELVTDKQDFQNIVNAKAEAAQQQGTSRLDEWKVLENQTKPSDYSILDDLGSGLLTAAKIAGAVMLL